MSDLNDFVSFVHFARRNREVGPRRYLRDYSDPFTKYSEDEFHSRYRFTPDAVKNIILPMLTELRRPSKRGLPFAPEIMLLVTLRFFATGSFKKMDGDVMNICQQTGSRIITRVSTLLASKMKYHVKFPSSVERINTVKQQFYEIAQFPDVIGCIDCTHIKIKNPGGATSKVFKNRKGWFSIKVQAVSGPNMEFYSVVARWPGSTHNSFIYNSSSVKQKINTGILQGVLLGDSGYALSDELMTPFLSPDSSSQEAYNRSHINTFNTIEKCFGIWKKRFPCLQVGMAIKLETVVAVICACATLHNIAIKINDSLDLTCDEDSEDIVDVVPVTKDPNSNGFFVRQSIAEKYFAPNKIT